MLGTLLMPAALLTPVQYFMPTWVLFMIVGIPQIMLVTAAYTMAGPVFQSVLPYRLRGLGSALGGLYIFFIGAAGGALLAAFLTNEFGVRVAVLVLLIPSTLVGGFLFFRSAAFVKSDLAVAAAEVKEELDEYERRQADPDAVPHLQLKNIDYSYGPVQVLFGVSLEVQRGEVLALVGTNGAGKSSALRVISGLGTPSRGVVRLAGQTITYVAPEQRVRLGIQMVPGGKATFGTMTVAENLEMAAYTYRRDPEQRDRRIRDALELFPLLAERRSDLAGSLSGGQQQMLGLARALLHEPEVLLIDELSLGLAPLVVQELIRVLRELKARGITMIVVEQSLSVAAQIADRAVFLEKGEVRFEGSCDDLLNRDDLARAVFLGAEGG
jgi:ABC-type branched-subunit amino acid transport system ATPase component